MLSEYSTACNLTLHPQHQPQQLCCEHSILKQRIRPRSISLSPTKTNFPFPAQLLRFPAEPCTAGAYCRLFAPKSQQQETVPKINWEQVEESGSLQAKDPQAITVPTKGSHSESKKRKRSERYQYGFSAIHQEQSTSEGQVENVAEWKP